MIYIGQTVKLKEEVDYCPLSKDESYNVQDTNALALSSKIGKPDTNNLVWESWWVENKYLEVIQ